jgi:hypothetical protein
MFSRQSFVEMGNCFQLKADFCIFRLSSVISVPQDGMCHAAAGCCAGLGQIFVHQIFKRAGSFIPLHRWTAGPLGSGDRSRKWSQGHVQVTNFGNSAAVWA